MGKPDAVRGEGRARVVLLPRAGKADRPTKRPPLERGIIGRRLQGALEIRDGVGAAARLGPGSPDEGARSASARAARWSPCLRSAASRMRRASAPSTPVG
jgi:hypothetical protein